MEELMTNSRTEEAACATGEDPISRIVAPSLAAVQFNFDAVAKWVEIDRARQQQEVPDSQEHLLTGCRIALQIMETCQVAVEKCTSAVDMAKTFQAVVQAQLPTFREVHLDTEKMEAEIAAFGERQLMLDAQRTGCAEQITNASVFFDSLTQRFHGMTPTRVGFSQQTVVRAC
jgi:hypothetical protein